MKKELYKLFDKRDDGEVLVAESDDVEYLLHLINHREVVFMGRFVIKKNGKKVKLTYSNPPILKTYKGG